MSEAVLTELQLEHEATWRTLDAAASQRDLLVTYHGVVITVVSLLLDRADGDAGRFASVALVVLLAGVAHHGFLGVQALRLLQHEQDAAVGHARALLMAAGAPEPWFAPGAQNVRPLREQRDPMGLAVSFVRLLATVDAAAAGALLVWLVRDDGDGSTVALGAGVAALAAIVSFLWSRRHLLQTEAETQARLRGRASALRPG